MCVYIQTIKFCLFHPHIFTWTYQVLAWYMDEKEYTFSMSGVKGTDYGGAIKGLGLNGFVHLKPVYA